MKGFSIGQEVEINGTGLKGVVTDATLGKEIEHFDNGIYVQEVKLLTIEIELHPDSVTPAERSGNQGEQS